MCRVCVDECSDLDPSPSLEAPSRLYRLSVISTRLRFCTKGGPCTCPCEQGTSAPWQPLRGDSGPEREAPAQTSRNACGGPLLHHQQL